MRTTTQLIDGDKADEQLNHEIKRASAQSKARSGFGRVLQKARRIARYCVLFEANLEELCRAKAAVEAGS